MPPNLKSKNKSLCKLICDNLKLKILFNGLKIVCLVCTYFTFSIGLTFLQKKFISKFKFPLTVVTCHLVMKFLYALICRSVYQVCAKKSRITLEWNVYIFKLGAIGLFCALDIGLSNWSFEFITVSLYTMSKSTAIIFILIFSVIFGLEKLRLSSAVTVLLISGGLFLFTYHSTQFSFVGFLMVITASFVSGLRWTLSQLVMQKNEIGLTNPLDMVYHVQPWMIITILPLTIGFEGLTIIKSELFNFVDYQSMLHIVGLILGGSLVAFLMEIAEYLLLSQTSSLSLSICGIIKEILTLGLAYEINHDTMSKANASGLVLCLFGIILHIILKFTHVEHKKDLRNDMEMQELLSGDESDEDEIFNKSMIT